MIYIRTVKNDSISLTSQMIVGTDSAYSGGGGVRLTWAHDGQRLALEGMQGGTEGGTAAIQVWDTSATRLVGVYPGSLAGWAWNGRLLATITPKDGSSIDVWDTASGSLVAAYRATAAMWSPDHRRLAMSIQSGGDVQVWDVGLRKRLSIIPGYAVSWAPDGERLLVCQGDSVCVYRA